MLNLAYSRDVPAPMIEMLEHHGRRLGLALDALERLGQSLDLVEGFIVACEAGQGQAYADVTGATRGPIPSPRVALARVQAARLFHA